MSNTSALARMEASNAPRSVKSAFMNMLDKVGGAGERITTIQKATAKHLESGATAVQEVAIGGATALSLAALDVYQPDGGLDLKSKYPVDAGLALVGIAGSVAAAGHMSAPILRSVGNAAANIFLFRKGHSYFTSKHAAQGGVPNGSMASPITPSGNADQQAAAAAGAASWRGTPGATPAAGFGSEAANSQLQADTQRLMAGLE